MQTVEYVSARKENKMIRNCLMALEALASIKAAMYSNEWAMAQKICEEELDFATLPTFQQVEPGQVLLIADQRTAEARYPIALDIELDIKRLHGALKARNRTMVDNLLISIRQKFQAPADETAVV
jgi:hypothetical protein